MNINNSTTIRFSSIEPIKQLIRNGDLNKALEIIFNNVNMLVYNKDYKHKFNFIPQLDELTQEIGELVYKSQTHSNNPTNKSLNVFIVTELYQTGGHSRVLEDILDTTIMDNVVIITDIFNRYASGALELGEIINKLGKATILILPKSTVLKKVESLTKLLNHLSPKSIGIIAHHQDVVAYAACNSSVKRNQVYIHHADHNPTLGSTIKRYIHLDLTPGDYQMCLSAEYTNPIHLPLTSKINFFKSNSAHTSTATSGTFNKFSTTGDLAYCEIVKQILLTIDGNHYHIGPIPENYLHKIKMELSASSIDPERFVYLGAVNSLSETLKANNINVYISSAPIGGAKAYIEALSCGLPILRYPMKDDTLHEEYFYPNSIKTWETLKELKLLLENLDPKAEREISKSHFLEHHHPNNFKKIINTYF